MVCLFLLVPFLCYKLDMATEILSRSLKETENAAKVFFQKLLPKKDGATVVALSGDLGSGKTTFVQSTARLLGIKDRVTSPTFVIMKKFSIFPKGQQAANGAGNFQFSNLYHIDAYRLKSGEELRKLGWNEMIADPKNLIFIEWPENVIDVIPKDATKISFKFIDENTRRIKF